MEKETYNLSADEVLKKFSATTAGLKQKEAEERIKEFGSNEVEKKQNWSFSFRSRINSYKEFRYWMSDMIEKILGIRLFEYKGYKLVR